MQLHCPYRQSILLQQALASNKMRIAFFLGAGCPVSIRISESNEVRPFTWAVSGERNQEPVPLRSSIIDVTPSAQTYQAIGYNQRKPWGLVFPSECPKGYSKAHQLGGLSQNRVREDSPPSRQLILRASNSPAPTPTPFCLRRPLPCKHRFYRTRSCQLGRMYRLES